LIKHLEIKNHDTLTQKEIQYIKRFTLSPITGFYLLARKQIIPFVILFGLDLFNYFVRLKFINTDYFSHIDLGFYILTSVIFNGLFFAYCLYARRISWNVCKWESFDQFQQSEKKWNIVTWIFIISVSIAVTLILKHF